jgi:hypothetical protein
MMQREQDEEYDKLRRLRLKEFEEERLRREQ